MPERGGVKKCEKSAEFWEASSIYRGEKASKKLAEWLEYELGCILISKKSKNVRFISISKYRSALQECRMALLGAGPTFEFRSNLDSFFEFFLSWDLHLGAFNLYSKNLTPFLDDLGLCSNDYLVDKYLEKSWLSTISLLSDYPLYSHASKSIFDTN